MKAMKADATPLLKFIKDNKENQLVILPSIRGCIVGKGNNAKNYGMIL